MSDRNRWINDGRIDAILQKLEDQEKREVERLSAQERLLDAKLKPFMDLVQENDKILNDKENGVCIRLDRLWQREKVEAWVFGLLSVPVLGGIGNLIWDWIQGKKQ